MHKQSKVKKCISHRPHIETGKKHKIENSCVDMMPTVKCLVHFYIHGCAFENNSLNE